MSTNKLHISDIANRILALREAFSTDKEFLNECNIENHSFITTLRKGSNKNPGSDYLEKIVRGTGCSGTWLLTGEGEKYEIRVNKNPATESEQSAEGQVSFSLLNQAFDLLNRIEQQANVQSTNPLPADVEVVLSRLLHTSLERRNKAVQGDRDD